MGANREQRTARAVDAINTLSAEMRRLLGNTPSREHSLAQTKLEECWLWLREAIAKDPVDERD